MGIGKFWTLQERPRTGFSAVVNDRHGRSAPNWSHTAWQTRHGGWLRSCGEEYERLRTAWKRLKTKPSMVGAAPELPQDDASMRER